jgi:hypothetical protein
MTNLGTFTASGIQNFRNTSEDGAGLHLASDGLPCWGRWTLQNPIVAGDTITISGVAFGTGGSTSASFIVNGSPLHPGIYADGPFTVTGTALVAGSTVDIKAASGQEVSYSSLSVDKAD